MKLGCAVVGGHVLMSFLEPRYQVRQLFDPGERGNLWFEDELEP